MNMPMIYMETTQKEKKTRGTNMLAKDIEIFLTFCGRTIVFVLKIYFFQACVKEIF